MSNCIPTTKNTNRQGYGITYVNRKQVLHHRLVYMQYHRVTLNPNQVVMHTCDNPSCVNIEHLVLGNSSLNQQDKVNKNRHSHGISHGMHKLTDSDVLFIRSSELPPRELKKLFAISGYTIQDIRAGRTWKHLL